MDKLYSEVGLNEKSQPPNKRRTQLRCWMLWPANLQATLRAALYNSRMGATRQATREDSLGESITKDARVNISVEINSEQKTQTIALKGEAIRAKTLVPLTHDAKELDQLTPRELQ